MTVWIGIPRGPAINKQHTQRTSEESLKREPFTKLWPWCRKTKTESTVPQGHSQKVQSPPLGLKGEERKQLWEPGKSCMETPPDNSCDFWLMVFVSPWQYTQRENQGSQDPGIILFSSSMLLTGN